jgi:hypothetical protein
MHIELRTTHDAARKTEIIWRCANKKAPAWMTQRPTRKETYIAPPLRFIIYTLRHGAVLLGLLNICLCWAYSAALQFNPLPSSHTGGYALDKKHDNLFVLFLCPFIVKSNIETAKRQIKSQTFFFFSLAE